MTELATPETSRRVPSALLWALPSQAFSRFFVLLLAVLGASGFAYEQLSYTADSLGRRATCYSEFSGDGLSGTAYVAEIRAQDDCLRPLYQHSLAWILTGIGGLLGLAVLIYLAMPFLEIRFRRLRRFRSGEHDRILAHLDTLAGTAGLRSSPTFVYSLSRRVNANTFGFFPRYFVRLDGGLVALLDSDPPAFDALLAHELAHLRWKEIGRAHV